MKEWITIIESHYSGNDLSMSRADDCLRLRILGEEIKNIINRIVKELQYLHANYLYIFWSIKKLRCIGCGWLLVGSYLRLRGTEHTVLRILTSFIQWSLLHGQSSVAATKVVVAGPLWQNCILTFEILMTARTALCEN